MRWIKHNKNVIQAFRPDSRFLKAWSSIVAERGGIPLPVVIDWIDWIVAGIANRWTLVADYSEPCSDIDSEIGSSFGTVVCMYWQLPEGAERLFDGLATPFEWFERLYVHVEPTVPIGSHLLAPD
jgi:hypothetical protein